ncbi:MAG TPA: hypothetical protein V6D17_05855 [Candidatus Obscuribacterales bacterium]
MEAEQQNPVVKRAPPGAVKLLLLSALLGAIFGGGLGYSHFLSEARDWGKTWDNYNDFIGSEIVISICLVLTVTLVCWVVSLLATWLQKADNKGNGSH